VLRRASQNSRFGAFALWCAERTRSTGEQVIAQEFSMAADRAANPDGTFPDIRELLARFTGRRARIGIIGLGYVGMPLALTAAKAGYRFSPRASISSISLRDRLSRVSSTSRPTTPS
jgi:hypothetical protein